MKNLIESIKNLWYWRKVIWYDKWWDYSFIFTILEHKLNHTANQFEKYGAHESNKEIVLELRELAKWIQWVKTEFDDEDLDDCLELLDESEKSIIIETEFYEYRVKAFLTEKYKNKIFQNLSKNIFKYWD